MLKFFISSSNCRRLINKFDYKSSFLFTDQHSNENPFFLFYLLSQLWYPLAKTLSEQAAWALAMDRRLNMVSINPGLVLGPAVAEENSGSTISYLKGRTNFF